MRRYRYPALSVDLITLSTTGPTLLSVAGIAPVMRQRRKDIVHPRRITVIEDDENVAGLIEFMLRAEGFAPSIVRDGRAALQLVREDAPPDAVVLDHLLPYCDGLEVASAMRADARWSAVPIVLLRSFAERGGDARLVDASLTKPFDPVALVGDLKRLLEQAP